MIEIKNITKRFDSETVVDNLSLAMDSNEFLALLGPSGCGKTTLLRIIAGIETPDEGQILVDGKDITHLPPHSRPTNMMFQSYALFPHLTVEKNILFGLRLKKLPKAQQHAKLEEMLEMLHVKELRKRYPHQISGGQKQRVALARALACEPAVLLLDEPFTALDRQLREHTREEIKALQQQLQTPFIIVTHDQEEAMGISSKMGVMMHGDLLQVGPPEEIYRQPNSLRVANFLGKVNALPLHRSPDGEAWLSVAPEFSIPMHAGEQTFNDTATLAIRPEGISLSTVAGGDAEGITGFESTVSDIQFAGARVKVKVQVSDALEWEADMSSDAITGMTPGEKVRVCFGRNACQLFPASTSTGG